MNTLHVIIIEKIIEDVIGDVFEAIKLYNDTYGNINTDCSKPQFYAMLCYAVLTDVCQAKIEIEMDDNKIFVIFSFCS